MAGLSGVILPVLDDWDSLVQVLDGLAQSPTTSPYHVIVVDDGSSSPPPPALAHLVGKGSIHGLELIHLAFNLGHQRAIAVGLSIAAQRDDLTSVIVMDSDGEDRPADVATLNSIFLRNSGRVVLARRAHRSENWKFRCGYFGYKILFRVLTGKTIDFGNFCLLPIAAVRSLVRMPDVWNNLAATLMRSRLPSVRVAIDRGHRLGGRSHMNLSALVLHGLSAMSVYSDLIFVRILVAAGVVTALTVLGLIAVTAIKFMTNYAIPGWATVVFGDLLIILSQTMVMVVATTLAMLGNRRQRAIIPAVDAPQFVARRTEMMPNGQVGPGAIAA